VRHDTAVFIPQDASTLLSEGAFKEQGGAVGTTHDIGITGFFAPTPQNNGDGVITSASPAGQQSGARDLRLPRQPELQRAAAVGVLARHVEDDKARGGEPQRRADEEVRERRRGDL